MPKGTDSGAGGAGGFAPPDSFGSKDRDLVDIKTHKELQKYLDDSGYNVTLGWGTRKVDVNVLKQSVQGITEMIDEFPTMKGIPVTLKTSTARSYAARMSADAAMRDFTITLGSSMKNGTLESIARSMNGSDFHPSNQTAASTIAHEAGHFFEAVLAVKKYGHTYKAFVDFDNCSSAREIVEAAVRKVQLSESRGHDALIREISRYATTDMSETLAEGVADVYANRGNAKPLSRAIWEVMKEQGV